MGFCVFLEKESFKFSGTHFTIFSAERAERLHGHNYHVRAEFEVTKISPELGMAFDFNLVKPLIQQLCAQLDEHILLAIRSPFLKIEKSEGQTQVRFADRTYIFPATDVCELPIANVTSEELARWLTAELAQAMPKNLGISAIRLSVEETRGQGVSFTLNL